MNFICFLLKFMFKSILTLKSVQDKVKSVCQIKIWKVILELQKKILYEGSLEVFKN